MALDLNGNLLDDTGLAEAYGLRKQDEWTEGHTMMVQAGHNRNRRFYLTREQCETVAYNGVPLALATAVSLVGGIIATGLSVYFSSNWDYLLITIATLVGIPVSISRLSARDTVVASASIFAAGLFCAHLVFASKILHGQVPGGIDATTNAILAKMPASHWWILALTCLFCIRQAIPDQK